MGFEQGYTITQDGTWPLEQYRIKIQNPPFSYGSQYDYPYQTSFFYVNNPIVRIDEILKKHLSFVNIEVASTDQFINLSWLNTNSNIALNVSAQRLYEYGHFSQFFKSNRPSPDVLYSFTFFPKKLVLKPISSKKVNGNFELVLSAVLIQEKSTYFSHPIPDSPLYAPKSLYDYVSDAETLYINNNDTSKVTFFYDLSATQEIVKKSIYTFGNTPQTNPLSRNFQLEPNYTGNIKIRPDSFFLEGTFNYPVFDLEGRGGWYIENISYIYGDNPQASMPYNANFLMYYDTVNAPNTQTFSYVQSAFDRDIFESSISSVLSASLTLNNGLLKYSAKKSPNTNTNLVSGLQNTDLTVSYVCDSDVLKNSNETVKNTIISLSIQGTPSFTKDDIGKGVYSSLSLKNDTITYVTKYPPYYYSYNVGVSANNLTRKTDNHNLSFYPNLKSTTDTTQPIFSAKTFFDSDFNFLSLDSTIFYNDNDYIMYQPDYTDIPLLENTIVYYKENGVRKQYSLTNPTWVKLKDANIIEINNPKTFTGNPVLTIRPKISTYSGFKDANIASKIILTGQLQVEKYPLDLKIIEQGNDFIDLTSETMINEEEFPGIDLRESKISWNVEPITSSTKVNYLLKDSNGIYSPINTINLNQSLDFKNTTWAIRVSGYAGTTTRITLSSQKRNDKAYIDTDLFFYDAFSDKKLLIEPKVDLDNSPEIRTITLKCIVPYKGRYYDLPKKNTIYWDWSYDDDTYTSLISAVYENQSTYTKNDNNFCENLSALKFLIKPLRSNNPTSHKVKINCYTVDTSEFLTDSYEFEVDTFPSLSLVDANIQVAYNSFPSEILLDTTKNQNILTRSFSQNTNYIFKPVLKQGLSYQSIQWIVVEPTGNIVTSTNTDFNYNATQLGKYEVTLKLVNFKSTTWTKTHDIEKKITLYKLEDIVFNKELKFLLFPEYGFKSNDQVNILTKSDYKTLAVSTTAYKYKKSNTETYYLSSNVNFDRYIYTQGSSKDLLLDTTDDGVNKVTLKYTNEFLSSVGTKIYLSAFNEFFPSNTPLYYKALENGSLITRKYNIFSETIPYSMSTPTESLFFQNPKLVDYNSFLHGFNVNLSIYDLDFNRNIVVTQNFTNSPLNTPAKIISNQSSVTYTLSTDKWIVKKEVPALNGSYTIFTIKPGDSYSPLRVSDVLRTTLYLNASCDLNIKIPETTFNTINQGNLGLKIGGDLWDSKNITLPNKTNWTTLQAYTTSTLPEIFLSTNYTLTGKQIFVEFKTPEYTTNPITSYAVDFGEGDIQIKDKNEKFYISYSSTGTYYITFSAIYQNSTIKIFKVKTPFIIDKKWNEYNEESVRIISETNLEPPYGLNEILIQPNEFGDSDIFNTALKRLDDNLTYLKNNIQTMNASSPTYYYGWMGSNRDNKSAGIRWYTETYGSEFYQIPYYNIDEGKTFFKNIKDVYFGKYIYVLDDKRFRLFDRDKNCTEVQFSNASDMEELFFDPMSIALSDDESSIYVADSIRHRIYRFDFDFKDSVYPIFTLVMSIGTLGSLNDNDRFDFPSELFFNDDYVYVLDYNNNCIKQLSDSLSWAYTYYSDELQNDQILNFTVHKTGLIYLVTKNNKLHIFDQFSDFIYATFELKELGTSEVTKITFDENYEFLYVVTTNNIFKYTSIGEYITMFKLPDIAGLTFTSASFSENREINISTKNSILKFQDIVQLFKIGDGLDGKYWSQDQIFLKKEEFATDINYNLALNRTAQNLKTFRNTLNAKFVLVTEQTPRGTATYFSLIPLPKEEKVVLDDDVEKEQLRIGVNEFHVPTVINRELTKLFTSQNLLTQKLNVTNTNNSSFSLDSNSSSKCTGEFCWSWKGMSCYDLSLPIIRLCNINPITYAELMDTFPVNYAPTKKWQDAISSCCAEYASPLI